MQLPINLAQPNAASLRHRSRRGPIRWLATHCAFGLALLSAACTDSVRPIATAKPELESPRLELDYSYCLSSLEKCLSILRGINHLRDHNDATCRDLGETAYSRYWGDSGHYVDGTTTHPTWWMGVNMTTTGNGWSGHEAVDGNVLVFQHVDAGATDGQIGSVVAHEEMHHRGWRHGAATNGLDHDVEISSRAAQCVQ